ncbi:unnamed protein product [marine sediment metagenome]|uniref:Uncharacterized protein n=1 Tax=marine sediment metagenome TaxID=412755 RepID=X1SD46_9ZZZZ
MSPLLDYTTKVPVSRTISQIQAKLVEHGARAVVMEYGDDRRVKALSFNVKMPNGELPIRLPINAAATLKVLQRQASDREIPAGYAKDDHAYRVAWRNIFHWISAQMALLETEMVKMEEIFLGYVITPGGQTIYEVMAGKGFLLGEGKSES